MGEYQEYADKLGWDSLTPAQVDALDYWTEEIENELPNPDRLCVYYPTGKGKTGIMLMCAALRGVTEVLVIAPPSTHPAWEATGVKLGLHVTAISHAKFRMKDFKLKRETCLLVDEFHLLGGQTGAGWKKLDRAAAGLKAPLIIASATPEYNDAERVYCVAHVTDPGNHRGGFETWLYENCLTKPNPFRRLPDVVGLKHHADSETFLASLPGVVYIPDDAPDILRDYDVPAPIPSEFEEYGLDASQGRIMASQMEAKHRQRYLEIIDVSGMHMTRAEVVEALASCADLSDDRVLIYCNHSTIAEIIYRDYQSAGPTGLVTGATSKKEKARLIQEFISGEINILIGTASLATGTDGMDKVCDTLIIVDDTDDPSLRRQLVGRILARGVGGNNDNKVAYRFVYGQEG